MGKVDPYEVSGDLDYKKLVKQFGVSKITPAILKKLGTKNLLLTRGAFYAHRDLNKILKGKFAIVTGRGPSEKMHIAHLAMFRAVVDLQKKHGCFVFIPFSDDEKILVKGTDYVKTQRMSLENAKDILALGFDPKKTKIMFDLKHMNQDIYNLAINASSKITISTVKAVMGFKDSKNIGSFFYPAIQIAHILYPTFKRKVPTIMITAIDQDPFVRLARDVSERMGLKKPGALTIKFLPGLSGGAKMSSSDPSSALYTDDSDAEIERKIKRAFSGGKETLAEHKKYGGNPDIDASFQYLKFFLEDDDKKLAEIERRYKSGDLMSGELKSYTISKAKNFFAQHRKNRKKVKLERYLI